MVRQEKEKAEIQYTKIIQQGRDEAEAMLQKRLKDEVAKAEVIFQEKVTMGKAEAERIFLEQKEIGEAEGEKMCREMIDVACQNVTEGSASDDFCLEFFFFTDTDFRRLKRQPESIYGSFYDTVFFFTCHMTINRYDISTFTP